MRYQSFAPDDRLSRRSLADAVDVLCTIPGFDKNSRASVRVAPMPLPSGELVGLVNVEFRAPELELVCCVAMPTSSGFLGLCPDSARGRFDIFRLDKAAVDYQAVVKLAGGTSLRAVELVPANLPLNPTPLEWRIVRYTIEFIEHTERCYRSLADHVPSEIRDQVPNTHFLDCSKLRGLQIPSRDSIQAYIAQRDPALKRLSRQKISDALINFGLVQTRRDTP